MLPGLCMRRFFLIGAILVATLLLVGGVAGHFVLRSDLPRRIVERELADALGLDVRLDALRIGWTGRSSATGVRIALPLDDKPLLEAPRLELQHTAILAMVTGFDLRTARVVGPTVYVREGVDGQWNLDHARQIVATRLAQRVPRPGPPSPPPLPQIDIVDARLVIDRHAMAEQRFDQVAVRGRSRGPMAYAIELDADPLGEARASFALVAPFMHEATFDLQPASRLLEALLGDAPDTRVRGAWRGRYERDRLRGTLELEELTGPSVRVVGNARVLAGGEPPQLAIEPIRLDVEVAGLAPLRVGTGRVAVYDQSLRLEDLRAAGYDGWARLAGHLELDELTGRIDAEWHGLALPEPLRHAGQLQATLTRYGPIMRRLRATARAQGTGPDGPITAGIELTATGTGLDNLAGTLRAPELRFAFDGSDYRLDNASAAFRLDEHELELTHLTASDPVHATLVTGRARLDRRDNTWAGRLDAQQLALPGLPAVIDSLAVRLRGDEAQAVLEEARLVAMHAEATATGVYRFADDAPLALRLRIERVALPAAVAAVAGAGVAGEDAAVVHARRIAGEAALAGTLRPLELVAEANVVARDLHVHRDALGDVELRLRANADADAASFDADAIEWLDGQWRFSGRFNRRTGRALLALQAQDIDLTLAQGVLAQPLGLTLGRADVSLEATGLAGQPDAGRVEGRFVMRDLERQPLHVEHLQGDLELAGGWLRIHSIEARQDDGRLTGELSLALAQPTRPRVDVTIEQWPVELAPGLAARLAARLDLELDAAQRRGFGEIAADAELTRQGVDLGTARLALTMHEQIVTLDELTGSTLDGAFTGTGRINLHTPLASELHLQWRDLQPAALAELSPHLAQTQGSVSGELSLRRSVAERPLGLMQLDVELTGEQLSYAELPVGDGHARAFFDFQPVDDTAAPLLGLSRIVLDEATLHAIDGELSLWARAVRRPGTAAGTWQWFGHVDGSIDNIDLETLTTALNPEATPTIGRLSAQANLSVPLDFQRREAPADMPAAVAALPVDHDRWAGAFGRGSLSLRESDLAAVPLFAQIYDFMNLSIIGRQAQGRGEGRFRIDEGMLIFERFRYHNRGLQINLAGRLDDVWAGGESALSGYALLSFQPLPDIEFVDVLGEALDALQAGLTAAEFHGTVSDPGVRAAPARGLGRAIRTLVTGSGEPD